jgi:hypothetical protein
MIDGHYPSTLSRLARRRGPAADLEHLQLLLDRFRSHYNQERPHQGIGDATPAERYVPGPTPRQRLGEPTPAETERRPDCPPHSLLRKVWRNGVVSYQGMAITLGQRYAGAVVRIDEVGELDLYLGDQLIRVLAPDRTKRCQKLGRQTRRRL